MNKLSSWNIGLPHSIKRLVQHSINHQKVWNIDGESRTKVAAGKRSDETSATIVDYVSS